MKKLGYEGIGEVVVTVAVSEEMERGTPVCMEGNGAVRPCQADEMFCGVALGRRGEFGAVQVKGFVTVPYSGELAVGWAALAADGDGGVCKSESGLKYLIMEVDEDEYTAVICL